MKEIKTNKPKAQTNDDYISHDKKETVRLNKYISDSGFCSRRKADRLIESGCVTVDGVLSGLGTKVLSSQEIRINGELVNAKKKRVYIALNKPAGITSTTDIEVTGNLTTFMNYPEIIFPIGRLDKESTGLLLMTNDGDIVNKILREEFGHDKEYLVEVNKPIDNIFLNEMAEGVIIFNPVSKKYQKTNPCKIIKVDDYSFKIILNQGLNRQIRRMTKVLNYRVVKLIRLRVMNVLLNNLPEGQWRYLTKDELISINKAIHGENVK